MEQTENENKAAGAPSALNVGLGGWLPIATAPKDETVIDIYTPEHRIGRCVYMRRVDLGKGNIFYEQTQGGYSCIRTATHWMPLPEDPIIATGMPR